MNDNWSDHFGNFYNMGPSQDGFYVTYPNGLGPPNNSVDMTYAFFYGQPIDLMPRTLEEVDRTGRVHYG